MDAAVVDPFDEELLEIDVDFVDMEVESTNGRNLNEREKAIVRAMLKIVMVRHP